MTTSIREMLERRYEVDVSQGIRESVGSLHPFYRSNPEAFPYESVRTLLRSVDWPTRLQEVRDYPADREHGWSDTLQGVTTDGTNWYFTQERTLWKFPLEHDLAEDVSETDQSRGILTATIPHDGYDHFGDLDYHDERVYVALESHEDHNTPLLCVFDAVTLEQRWSAVLTRQGRAAPWCAINPLNGLLYSSEFVDSHLRVYEPTRPTESTGPLPYCGAFELEMEVPNIQGGVFSQTGHLYLVSDTEDDGIYGFDMITGERRLHTKIDYDRDVLGFGPNEELEGITIVDVETDQSPGVERSQIHLVMLDNDPGSDSIGGTDDFYLKHFRVADRETPLI